MTTIYELLESFACINGPLISVFSKVSDAISNDHLERRNETLSSAIQQTNRWGAFYTKVGRRVLLLSSLLGAVLLWAATTRRPETVAEFERPVTPIARIAGKGWAYDLAFPVYNAATIARLIECESQGLNIGRPDSNGQMSWGVLQFNGTSTWQEMERRFHFYGDPRNPAQAIHMADMMISNGLLGRWSCARTLGMVNAPAK